MIIVEATLCILVILGVVYGIGYAHGNSDKKEEKK